MNSKIKLSIIVILVAFGTWLYFAPYLAVSGMKAGAEAKDAVKLSSYVNFPALKESLKASFRAKLASGAAKKPEGNPFGAVGAALAVAFVNPPASANIR